MTLTHNICIDMWRCKRNDTLSPVSYTHLSGLMEGKEVTWMPAYGPEQRGGTANVTVIVSDEKISLSLIHILPNGSRPDALYLPKMPAAANG